MARHSNTGFYGWLATIGRYANAALNWVIDSDDGKFEIRRESDGRVSMQVDAASGAVAVRGTSDGSDTSSGFVGELISAKKTVAFAQSLISGVNAQVLSVTLTAGDWDVSGNAVFITSTSNTVVSMYRASIVTAQEPQVASSDSDSYAAVVHAPSSAINSGGNGAVAIALPTRRVNVTTPTQVNLVVQTIFGTSGLSASGNLYARRAA